MDIKCIMCQLTGQADLAGDLYEKFEAYIEGKFFDASNNDIKLDISFKSLVGTEWDRMNPFALHLHRALGALVDNPPQPNPAQSIAVIFAHKYSAYEAALGVMFDRGFNPDGDDPNSNPVFRATPREGCAVFLGAIAASRPDPEQQEKEALFTTIHELGHVFNLQHESGGPHFLSFSPPSGADAYDINSPAFGFSAHHRHMLSKCSSSKNVWPGGSLFSDTGEFSNLSRARMNTKSQHVFGLDLKLSMAVREFWRFEPVELDIEVGIADGVDRSFRVPDAIDPGYEEFKIWIDMPNGERKRYRSPNRYCGIRKRRLVGPNKPFVRDISIFGGSGGFTFEESGIYTISAEFEFNKGQFIKSNALEVYVRPPGKRGGYQSYKEMFVEKGVSQSVYYRFLDGLDESAVSELLDVVSNLQEAAALDSLKYGLARALLNSFGQRSELRQVAVEILERLLDKGQLGKNQSVKAASLDSR